MRDWLSFAPFVVGMAVEAYLLPWLFLMQVVFYLWFVSLTWYPLVIRTRC